jgi:probable rRNA maturation factor
VLFLAKVRGLTAEQLRRALRAALADRQIASLSVAVIDDATMASLHRRYLNDPHSTDVMSFDLRDDPASKAIEGEIVVSAQTARRAAKNLGLTQGQEVLRYAIHGALHLAGYDDRTPGQRTRMRQREDQVLAALGEKIQGSSSVACGIGVPPVKPPARRRCHKHLAGWAFWLR